MVKDASAPAALFGFVDRYGRVLDEMWLDIAGALFDGLPRGLLKDGACMTDGLCCGHCLSPWLAVGCFSWSAPETHRQRAGGPGAPGYSWGACFIWSCTISEAVLTLTTSPI